MPSSRPKPKRSRPKPKRHVERNEVGGSAAATSTPRRRQRAPRGWVRVAWTRCGAPVFTPRDPKDRREHFDGCVAYVEDGAVWVRSKTAWLRNRRTRRHEEAHLAQIASLGQERFDFLYEICSLLGYWANPFEILARMAEQRP